MFIPIFIAILLGLASPAMHTSNCGGTVTVTTTTNGEPGDPGTGDPGTGDPGTGDPGDDGTGGDNSQLPPPKP